MHIPEHCMQMKGEEGIKMWLAAAGGGDVPGYYRSPREQSNGAESFAWLGA